MPVPSRFGPGLSRTRDLPQLDICGWSRPDPRRGVTPCPDPGGGRGGAHRRAPPLAPPYFRHPVVKRTSVTGSGNLPILSDAKYSNLMSHDPFIHVANDTRQVEARGRFNATEAIVAPLEIPSRGNLPNHSDAKYSNLMSHDSFTDYIWQVEAPSKALQEKRQAWLEDEGNDHKPMRDFVLRVQELANQPHSGLTNRQRREWVRKERRELSRKPTENIMTIFSKLIKGFPRG